MSEIKVNKISQRSGTAITLGNSGTDFQLPSGAELVAQSGSTITIAAGATITNNGSSTGFGATGAVNWDTTKKTTGFTAVNGVGYFCDTTSSAFTMTLPATPSAGDIVALKDYANTFDTNNLTVGRNGSNINGDAADAIISVQGQALTLIYIDATQGWSAIYGATDADLPVPQFVVATGGTVSCCGDFKIHTFTGPGTFTVTNAGNPFGSVALEYLVVAGAGGGSTGNNAGGGGGAGGLRFASPSLSPLSYPAKPLAGSTLTAAVQGYPITVGSGGPAGASGNSSVFSTITSAGGGSGGTTGAGVNGGSGGGGGSTNDSTYKNGGTGNTPPTSPSQGNNGGRGRHTPPISEGAGGGGGALAAGTDGDVSPGPGGGDGGVGGVGGGFPTAFGSNGAPSGGFQYYAGGGGAGGNRPSGGAGGLGGGGRGGTDPSPTSPRDGVSGTVNTGGGGGGAMSPGTGGTGGSGIVIIRYKFQ
jgi:hypothetical protein